MKALVFLCLLGIGLATTHSLSRRSLLGRGRGGHQHHEPAHHNAPRERQRQRQRSRGRKFSSRRAGRDGVHDTDHDSDHDSEHDSHHPITAISTGYLPAAADDYYDDDLAGYRAGEGQGLPGYEGEQGAVTERSLDSYDYDTTTTVITTTEFPDYEGSGRAADDQYGAPSNVDSSYAAPDGSYDAPGVDVTRTDTDYGAPGTDYSIPDNEYSNQNGFPFEAVEGRDGTASGGAERQCPGSSIEACVGVCPGTSVRVYGACVGGCADRCPDSRRS